MRVFFFLVILISSLFAFNPRYYIVTDELRIKFDRQPAEIRTKFKKQFDEYLKARAEFFDSYGETVSGLVKAAQEDDITEEEFHKQLEDLRKTKDTYDNSDTFNDFLEEYKNTEKEIAEIESGGSSGGGSLGGSLGGGSNGGSNGGGSLGGGSTGGGSNGGGSSSGGSSSGGSSSGSTGGGLEDAKGEIENINDLMDDKHDHKTDYVIPNTEKLLKLELHRFLTLRKTLQLKKNLTKINAFRKNRIDTEE